MELQHAVKPAQQNSAVRQSINKSMSHAPCKSWQPAYRRSGLQAKLVVGEPGDEYERDADKAAGAVMGMPAAGTSGVSFSSLAVYPGQVRRKCPGDKCPLKEDDDPGLVQRKVESPAMEVNQVPGIFTGDLGQGQPLDHGTRSFMEPRFGHDFGDVRVHTGERAEALASDLNARAFTLGQDIVFGKGYYSPATPKGRLLLAHEMAHVIQQGGSTKRVQRSLKKDATTANKDDSARYEVEWEKESPGGGVEQLPDDKTLIWNFKVGSDELKSEHVEALNGYIRSWDIHRLDPTAHLVVEGHTSDTGTEKGNARLSWKRAMRVKSYLFARCNIPWERIDVVPKGSKSPIVPNISSEARARNRGVEIKVIHHVEPTRVQEEPAPKADRPWTCGPDITQPLREVFTRIQSTFNSWDDRNKYKSCACITGNYPCNPIMSWDIVDLFLPETSWLYNTMTFGKECGWPQLGEPGEASIEKPERSPCGNSVQVGDRCFLAGTVNYGAYGIMCKLCFDHMTSLSRTRKFFDFKPYLHPNFFSEASMKRLIYAYKFITDDPDPPIAWAVATYRGGPGGVSGLENRGDCKARCPVPYSKRGSAFDYVWEPVAERRSGRR